LNILFVGDIFGSAGRRIVHEHIDHVREAHNVELLIVNAENAAGGFGVTPQIAEEFFDMGADVLTTGNHVWDKRELIEYMNSATPDSQNRARRILRPANFERGVPGFGIFEGVTTSGVVYAVVNLMGKVFMSGTNNPFLAANEILAGIKAKVIVVDFHGEATSEKVAMGWHLDGRVTAVVGTHTHVPTADDRVLPGGTAYITDVGMTGPRGGVIGVKREQAIESLATMMPVRFETSTEDPWLMGVLISASQPPRADAIAPVRRPAPGVT